MNWVIDVFKRQWNCLSHGWYAIKCFSNIHPPLALSCLLNSIRLSRQDCKVCAEISQSFHIKSELADKHSPTEVLFRVMLKAIEKLKACKISPIESAADSVVMVIAKRIGKQSFSSSRIISLRSQASSKFTSTFVGACKALELSVETEYCWCLFYSNSFCSSRQLKV